MEDKLQVDKQGPIHSGIASDILATLEAAMICSHDAAPGKVNLETLATSRTP